MIDFISTAIGSYLIVVAAYIVALTLYVFGYWMLLCSCTGANARRRFTSADSAPRTTASVMTRCAALSIMTYACQSIFLSSTKQTND